MQFISERGKHRLRIAARFLRQSGMRFEGENFYSMVIDSISKLSQDEQVGLRGLIDWLEGYELMELRIYAETPHRSRLRNSKPMFSRKQDRASGATVEITQNPDFKEHGEK